MQNLTGGEFYPDSVLYAQELTGEAEGSYLTVETMIGSKGYIIVMERANYYIVVFAVVAILAIVITIFIAIFLWNKRYRRANIPEDKKQDVEELSKSNMD